MCKPSARSYVRSRKMHAHNAASTPTATLDHSGGRGTRSEDSAAPGLRNREYQATR